MYGNEAKQRIKHSNEIKADHSKVSIVPDEKSINYRRTHQHPLIVMHVYIGKLKGKLLL